MTILGVGRARCSGETLELLGDRYRAHVRPPAQPARLRAFAPSSSSASPASLAPSSRSPRRTGAASGSDTRAALPRSGPPPARYGLLRAALRAGARLGVLVPFGNLGPTTKPGLPDETPRGERSLPDPSNPLCPSPNLARAFSPTPPAGRDRASSSCEETPLPYHSDHDQTS